MADEKAASEYVWRYDDFGRRQPAGGEDGPLAGGADRSTAKRSVVVLAVDDDPTIHDAMRLVLPRSYRLIGLSEGKEFMQMVEAYEPDLIILDVHLPGESGFVLCQRLRARPEFRHIPVLFLTVVAEDVAFRELLEVHGDAYLPKPFEPASLRDTVERLVGWRL